MLGKRASSEIGSNAEFVFVLDEDETDNAVPINKAARPASDTEAADHAFVPAEGQIVNCSQAQLPAKVSVYEQATQFMPYEDEYSQASQIAQSQETFSQFRDNIYKKQESNRTPSAISRNGCNSSPANQAATTGTINDAIADSVRAARERAELLAKTSTFPHRQPSSKPAAPIIPVSMSAQPKPANTQTLDDETYSQLCLLAYEELDWEFASALGLPDIGARKSSVPAAAPGVRVAHAHPRVAVPAPTINVPITTGTVVPLPFAPTQLTAAPPLSVPPTAAPQTTGAPLKAIMYFDGGALGNPGVGGAGYLLYPDYLRPPHVFPTEPIAQAAVRMIGTNCTNNQAEYTGLIHGLQAAVARGVRMLDVYGDSELVIKQMKGEYKVKNPVLKGMNQRAQRLADSFTKISYNWVDRNRNKLADALSRRAMNQPWTVEETADPIV